MTTTSKPTKISKTAAPAPPADVSAWRLPAFTLPDWLTVEVAAYALLVVAAFAIRIIDLGGRPLGPAETTTALRAWQASQGLGPTLDAGVPLLFSLEWVTFALFGANDALARFWPLLASVSLPIVLYFGRRWLGRQTTLLAATLLTLSPLLNAFGRRGDAVAIALLATAVAFTGWGRLRLDERSGWTWLAVGLGLLLISGPAAFTSIVALAIIAFLSWRSDRQALPAASLTHGVVFLAVVLVGGAAFLTHLDGLGLIAVNLSEWLASWTAVPLDWGWGLLRLLLDEPFLTVVGIVALVAGLRRQLLRPIAIAALVVVIIAVFQGPYAAGSRAVAALLFAFLVADLLLTFRHVAAFNWHRPETPLYALALAILLVIAVLSLLGYIDSAQSRHLVLLAVALGLCLLISVAFAFVIGPKVIASTAAVVILAFLLFFNLATAWGLAYGYVPPASRLCMKRMPAEACASWLIPSATSASANMASVRPCPWPWSPDRARMTPCTGICADSRT